MPPIPPKQKPQQQDHPVLRLAVLDDYTGRKNPLSSNAFGNLLIDVTQNRIQNAKYRLQGYDFYPETLNTKTSEGLNDAIERYKPYQIISTMRERTFFPAELIRALPNLKLLLTTGALNRGIDIEAAKECGVIVAGTGPKPNVVKGFDATNEQTWALILAVTKGIAADDLEVKANRNGGWQSSLNIGLAGKTLGLLGLGKLGVQAAVTGRLGFGMNIVAWSENLTQEKADKAAEEKGLSKGTFQVAASKEELFNHADVLSVHYVLSERSRGIVGEKELSWMKPSSVLVNTSRGPLVHEAALADALKKGQIRGVGLDVFDVEPLPTDSVWRDQDWGRKVVLSPHMGYVEEETMTSWYEQQADNVRHYLAGDKLDYIMA